MFKKIKNYILKTYLLNVVEELEKHCVDHKRWKTNADISLVLCQLLIANKSLVLDIEANNFMGQSIISPYINLTELEKYINDFITQSQPFIKGETSNRPKIVTSVSDDFRSIEYLSFIEYHGSDLVNVLVRIESLSTQVKGEISLAPPARREYLERMLVPVFSVLLGLIEKIYEAL